MHGDVVDGGARAATVVPEQVGGRRHAARYFADEAAFAAPVASHRAAITGIPFPPLRGEAADLVAAKADVPWLGHQLDPRQHRVLPDGGEEAARVVETVRSARKRGGESKAEAVDVAYCDPVAQRVHHHLQHARVGEIDRASAAGEVVVI